jgi:CheY-like chemotaxis protein
MALGHDVLFDDWEAGKLMRLLRVTLPDVFLIDLTRAPSNGRQAAMALRTYKDTRPIPIVFVGGDPAKVAGIKALLPDAVYSTWERIKTAIPRAVARPPRSPIVPPSSIYSGKPALEKLGVKSGMSVCILGGPKGVLQSLGTLPADVKVTARADADCHLFIQFTRNQRELVTALQQLARIITRQTLWIAWPKQASGTTSDINGNVVRETGLSTGWVDFKVCSINDTWSGLAFKRKK